MELKVAETLLHGFMAGICAKAEAELQELRSEAQDSNAENLLAIVAFLERIDVFDHARAEAWRGAAQVCPEASQHFGGRGWCFFCGDVNTETGLPTGAPPEAVIHVH